ncbi:MAG: hypothetical protein EA378_03830 [Phycisphaerales bacterium]|nr:MAG: hypothetical protein EA378_03830 [Phycisphaerales bacterium]
MELTCSECGHGFLCRDALNPKYQRLNGFWEHEPRGRRVRAFVRTLLWLAIPNLFWRRVRLHHEIRWRRLGVWAFGVPMVLILASICVQAIFIKFMAIGVVHWGFTLAPTPARYGYAGMHPAAWYALDKLLTVLAFFWPLLAYPVMLTVLDTSRRWAKLRMAHVIRATVYSTTVFSVFMMIEIGVVLWIAVSDLVEPTYLFSGVGVPLAMTHLIALYGLLNPIWYVYYPLSLVWLAWYWNRAMVANYRLHMGWPVWALLSVIAFLPVMMTSYGTWIVI